MSFILFAVTKSTKPLLSRWALVWEYQCYFFEVLMFLDRKLEFCRLRGEVVHVSNRLNPNGWRGAEHPYWISFPLFLSLDNGWGFQKKNIFSWSWKVSASDALKMCLCRLKNSEISIPCRLCGRGLLFRGGAAPLSPRSGCWISRWFLNREKNNITPRTSLITIYFGSNQSTLFGILCYFAIYHQGTGFFKPKLFEHRFFWRWYKMFGGRIPVQEQSTIVTKLKPFSKKIGRSDWNFLEWIYFQNICYNSSEESVITSHTCLTPIWSFFCSSFKSGSLFWFWKELNLEH